MEENSNSYVREEAMMKEAPQLCALLKEMKDGLDVLRSKIQILTAKVRENQFPTADGISYLEVKHLLLLSYCQTIIYYLLRKAKGMSIDGHPLVRNLVEIRLFLEKIRPIDKKMQYQIQKLTRISGNGDGIVKTDKMINVPSIDDEDLLKYKPNPDMLLSKFEQSEKEHDGIYKPPKFAPTTMEDEDKISKQEKLARRREKETLRHVKQSSYMKELIDNMEGRPEEVRETVGLESRELMRYKARLDDRAKQEEELFIRAPVTKKDKQKERRLKKSSNGLLSLTDGFYDEIKSLPLEEEGNEKHHSFRNTKQAAGKFHKRKRKH